MSSQPAVNPEATCEADAEDEEEVWKTIVDFPAYEVSSFGRIKTTRTGRIRKAYTDQDGYKRISLSKDGGKSKHYVHRLVADAFLPADLTRRTVNHKDSCRSNNRLVNLERATHREQYDHKEAKRGTKAPSRGTRPVWKVSPEDGRDLEWFSTATEAAASLGRKSALQKINSVCRGKSACAYSYFWRYDTTRDDDLDGEHWRPLQPELVKGAKGYMISSCGRLKNKSGRVQLPSVRSHGQSYPTAHVGGAEFKVHRLLAATFIPNPDKHSIVNHRDGNKGNWDISNLEWVTIQQNAQHALENGMIKHAVPVAQYTADGVLHATYSSIAHAARGSNMSTERMRQGIVKHGKLTSGLYTWVKMVMT